MKRIISFLTLLCMLLPTACRQQDSAELKLMSFNIRNGRADDGDNSWQFRKEAVTTMLCEQAPDCFGLQEAYSYQRDFILEQMPGYKAVGCGRNDGSDEGEHCCVFWNATRFDLLDSGNFWLSETPDEPSKGWDARLPRIATWVKLKDARTDKDFFLVNTHLDHIGIQARKESVLLIRDRIGTINPDAVPMIVMGDLNIQDGDSTIVFFNSLMNNSRDVAAVSDRINSFNGWGNPEKEEMIDYIYFSGFTSCEKFETVTGEWLGRKLVSDHNPITAILK